jgi:thioredoxin-related protein
MKKIGAVFEQKEYICITVFQQIHNYMFPKSIRNITIFCLFILTYNGIAQNNFKFDESDYQTIIKRSKQEKKSVFLMLYATWCPHCTKMKTEVLQDTLVQKLLNKNYIYSWQDIEKPEGIMLKNKFKVTSIPTFIFLDSNENELYRLKNEYKTTDFIAEIKNALNPKSQLPYLEKEFSKDPSNADKWLNYMNVMKKGRNRSDLSVTAHRYLETQSDQQLISQTNWQIISNGVTDITSREFQYVLHHQKEFEAISSPSRVERKISNIVTELLQPFTKNLDTINYKKQREIAQKIGSKKVDSLLFTYDIIIAERTGNWSSYKKTTIESTEKYAWNNSSLLKEISKNYLKHIAEIPSLKEAIKWTNHSLELNDVFDGNLLLSQLYLKINDKKMAVLKARKAKEICSGLGCNSKDIDELMLELGQK